MIDSTRRSELAVPASEAHATARDELPYVVAGVQRRTPAIAELWLLPREGPLGYRAGEYVLLEDREQRIAQRSYSIANSPRADGAISLLVTFVPGGQASSWVHGRLRVRDEVLLSGPYGTFVADPRLDAPRLYLAGGSGLAPMRALLEAEISSERPRPQTLLLSARSEADVLDRPRFTAWEREHQEFRFVRTLTRGPGAGPRGRIPRVLPELCAGLEHHEVFIAGAPGLVHDCRAAAEALGATRERIHTEPFFVEPVPWTEPRPAPPRGGGGHDAG